jgi:uncharacterized protein involved in type VI secretion and phage assembly
MNAFSNQGYANKQHYFIEVSGIPEQSFELIDLSSDDFALSKDYRMQTTALVRFPVNYDELIGQHISISTVWEDSKAYWHGEITEIIEQGSSHDGEQITIIMHSPLNRLKHFKHNRVFRDQSVIDIVRKIITDSEITQTIIVQGDSSPKPFVVQYEETDFDFICRLN